MKACAPGNGSSEHTNYAWKFQHLRWLHGVAAVQYWECAELDRFETLWVMAELQGKILCLKMFKEKYESPCVAYPPEGHMDFNNILLNQDAAVKLEVDMTIL